MLTNKQLTNLREILNKNVAKQTTDIIKWELTETDLDNTVILEVKATFEYDHLAHPQQRFMFSDVTVFNAMNDITKRTYSMGSVWTTATWDKVTWEINVHLPK